MDNNLIYFGGLGFVAVLAYARMKHADAAHYKAMFEQEKALRERMRETITSYENFFGRIRPRDAEIIPIRRIK